MSADYRDSAQKRDRSRLAESATENASELRRVAKRVWGTRSAVKAISHRSGNSAARKTLSGSALEVATVEHRAQLAILEGNPTNFGSSRAAVQWQGFRHRL
jgi:hypothetical protein